MRRLTTLSRLQQAVLIVLVSASAFSGVEIAQSIADGEWGVAVAWVTVIIGIALIWSAIDAVEYFRRQRAMAGGSWILTIFFRASVVVTIAATIVTIARMITLTAGPQILLSILSGIIIIIILLLPKAMQIVFQQHEGR